MATTTSLPTDEKLRQYVKDLRSECKERRLREKQLLAELAELRSANVDPIAAYIRATLDTAADSHGGIEP